MGSPGSLSKLNTGKRKLVPDGSPPASPVKKTRGSSTRLHKASAKTKEKLEVKSGQSTIASFFSQPKHFEPSKSLSPCPFQGKLKATDSIGSSTPLQDTNPDYELALLLSQSDDIQPSSTAKVSGSQDKDETKQAWSTLLAQTQIPKCFVHGEPAKEFTVNKSGPNKGKRFFLCSR
jgi:AP endonuclease-2